MQKLGMYACMHVHMHARTYVHARTYACTYVCMHVPMYVRIRSFQLYQFISSEPNFGYSQTIRMTVTICCM